MSLKSGTAQWAAGEEVLATDINTTFDAAMDVVQATLGGTVGDRKCVYLKNSDGKVYLADSDSFDEKIYNFLGISYQSGVANDVKFIRHKGIVSGLSGLTAGKTYYVAKAGSSDSDITKTYGGSTGPSEVGSNGTPDQRQGFNFTLTNPTKVTKLTLALLKKSGSPTGNLVAEIFYGTPSGSSPTGGLRSTGKMATQSMSALTTSYASYDLTYTDAFLPAGTYTVILYHDTLSNSNFALMDRDSNTDASFYRYPSVGNWVSGGGRTSYTLDFLAETFAAGDLTEYFYDFKKLVGKALSSTTLLLDTSTRMGTPVAKSANTDYTAETDGFIQVSESTTGSTITFQVYVDGVLLADWTTSSNSQNGGVTVPVAKGSIYQIVASGTPNMYFIPHF